MSKSFLAQQSRARIAKNFIQNYGKSRFHDFLSDLEKGISGEKIAEPLGVTRERVRQWKNTFGVEEKVFYPSEIVLRVMSNKSLIDTFPSSKPPTKKTQIKNFINRYGINVFRSFIKDSQRMMSGEVMGAKYNFSRERIRQLKNAFGSTKRNYRIYSNVNALRR